MQSWSLDLVAALRCGLPCFFSCANDYSDLAGETAIFERLLGARYLMGGTPCPFKACTVMTSERSEGAAAAGAAAARKPRRQQRRR
jgi:hypothetical protein|eukprot:COSAG01_NODE_5370_length_4303_cov_1.671265_2_plen_86_part_00